MRNLLWIIFLIVFFKIPRGIANSETEFNRISQLYTFKDLKNCEYLLNEYQQFLINEIVNDENICRVYDLMNRVDGSLIFCFKSFIEFEYFLN